jgi:hypothetical protein
VTQTTAAARRPDLSKCYGQYRNQTVEYALANCLACPKMKACVRATWGWDKPRRGRRDQWSGSKPRRDRRPPWPSLWDVGAT